MTFREALVARAVAEWERFGRDEGLNDKFIDPDGQTTTKSSTGGQSNRRKETVEPFASRVGDYWLSIPTKSYDSLVKSFAKKLGKLDGTIDLPWSAAFISYCMQLAGAGTSFPYSSGHATWMVKAISNRQQNKTKAALVGFRPGERVLQLGDLIGRPREAGVTYDNAVEKGWFISHSDIIVGIDLVKKKATLIGGNVGQSVSSYTVSIAADGKLNDPGGWIVHIENNIVFSDKPVQIAANALAAVQVG